MIGLKGRTLASRRWTYSLLTAADKPALRDLLAFLVREEVAKYNRKALGAEILQVLSAKEI